MLAMRGALDLLSGIAFVQLQIEERQVQFPLQNFENSTRPRPTQLQLCDRTEFGREERSPQRQAVGYHNEDNSRSSRFDTSSNTSHLMSIEGLEIFKSNYEAYSEQMRILTRELEKAIAERDSKIATIAHHSLMLEQTAMNRRLEEYTSVLELHLKQAQLEADMAF